MAIRCASKAIIIQDGCILHIFAAQVVGTRQEQPTEKDLYMEESVWMPLNEAEQQNINPDGIAACLRGIIENGETVWLGSRMIADIESHALNQKQSLARMIPEKAARRENR